MDLNIGTCLDNRMTRLSDNAFPARGNVELPRYGRSQVKRGVVHLGIGAFTRAHQIAYFEHALNAGDLRWGVVAASLRSAGVRDQMKSQDCLYTLVERDGDTERLHLIGAVQDVLVAPENPHALVAAMASAETEIVTLTVTEKGYKLDPVTGALLLDDPAIVADLATPDAPQTAPGFIVAALRARRDAGLTPFTAISCDNLPHNGQRLRDAVVALARASDPALADWIAERGAFPQTMVDRIVPATVDADISALADRTGVEDRAMVKTEPFSQWVIQDWFCGERPDFEAAGVQITPAVAPWEDAKLRLLNGAHSSIAYLGGLAGIEFVDQVVARPDGARFVEALWDEAASTLAPIEGLDVPAYRRQLMARFSNSALQHKTRQIAMDGSQKLPQRLLASIAARRERGQPVEALSLGVAAWMRWQDGCDDSGAGFTVDDPLADVLARAVAAATSPEDKVAALLSLPQIFPPALADDAVFRGDLVRHLASLTERGSPATLASFGD
jgi:fructuronate reductase